MSWFNGFYYFAIVGNNNIANFNKKHQPVDSKLMICKNFSVKPTQAYIKESHSPNII